MSRIVAFCLAVAASWYFIDWGYSRWIETLETHIQLLQAQNDYLEELARSHGSSLSQADKPQ